MSSKTVRPQEVPSQNMSVVSMAQKLDERRKLLRLVVGMVHGPNLPGTKLCKVRFMGRHWVRVWGRVRAGFVEVGRCILFPQGGEWREAESYVIG